MVITPRPLAIFRKPARGNHATMVHPTSIKRPFPVLALVLLFFTLAPFVAAQDSQQAVINTNQLTQYIQAQNDKLGARLDAKIEAQVTRVETNIKTEMQTAVSEAVTYISRQLIDALKVMVLGLGGVVIIVLSLFKVFEYKLSYTKNIKKYEAELQQKIADLEKQRVEFERMKTELKNEFDLAKANLDKQLHNLNPTKSLDERFGLLNESKVISQQEKTGDKNGVKTGFKVTARGVIVALVAIIALLVIGAVIYLIVLAPPRPS